MANSSHKNKKLKFDSEKFLVKTSNEQNTDSLTKMINLKITKNKKLFTYILIIASSNIRKFENYSQSMRLGQFL